MANDIPEIMTIQEASRFLRVPLSSLYKLVKTGDIPCQKVGRHWRFNRETLLKWVAGELNRNTNDSTRG
ncbi:MAG: hypothetical protein A2Z16_04635 [Chloroflexi bacterium RBG_16_54_18]|nr:MAG: hypothetical protein A2Z16_04635 [Chloroflexi bacterium RBG_16_54_18]